MTLIASRALLAVGAAMIVPATLAGIRSTCCRGQSAQYGAGAVGSGPAPAARPSARWWAVSAGAFLLGVGVLINVPIVLVVIAINAKVVPRQPRARTATQSLQALVLIAAILMLVFSAKSALKGQLALWLTALVALGRAAMLTWFIRSSCRRPRPMVDMRLFPIIILSGVMMAMTAALITTGRFELLMAGSCSLCTENAVRGEDIYALR